MRLMDEYHVGAERRYASRKLLRALTLGASGHRDAARAAEAALEELRALAQALEGISERRMMTALASRLRLFEVLTGSREEGTEVAMELLRTVLPTEAYQRILRLAQEGGRSDGE